MPLLLCDLDDTLVDRGAAFARWAGDSRRGMARATTSSSGCTRSTAPVRPAPDFFVDIHERLGLDETLDEFIADYYRRVPPQFRSDEAVRAALADARARLVHRHRHQRARDPARQDPSRGPRAAVDALVRLVCRGPREARRPPLEIAAERCGLTLDGAWMIGDNADADIGAAAGGRDPQCLAPARPAVAAEDFAPTYEADSFPEAVEMVSGA